MFETTPDPETIGAEQNQTEARPEAIDLYRADALELLQAAALNPDQKPEPLKPLLRYIDGSSGRPADFLCRGTLTMITGQKGCRKSTFVRALCAVLLNGRIDCESPHTITAKTSGLKIAVIDTEQHPSRVYNSYMWLQRTYKGTEPFSTRCGFYSGRGRDVDGLRELLRTICHTQRPDVVFLDVVSHFVDDINEQRPSKIMVDLINQICTRYGCAIVGIIHQNPNTQATAADKMAGALGTKLLQAAECVLHVARTPEGLQQIDADGNATGFLYGKGSIITFAEYRDRWPDIMQILITNENERGAFELNLQPVTIKNEQQRAGLSKTLTAFVQPARLVTAAAADIARAEANERALLLGFEPDQNQPAPTANDWAAIEPAPAPVDMNAAEPEPANDLPF